MNIFPTPLFNFPINIFDIKYDESMSPEMLNNIANKFINLYDYNNMKRCYTLAVEKKSTLAMVQLARYYTQIEPNKEEVIRLYNLAIDNDSGNGAHELAEYYKLNGDITNYIKYLDVSIDKFNNEESIIELISYYNGIKDETNSITYCDKLIKINSSRGYFTKGMTYEIYNKYTEMKECYNTFLNNLCINNFTDTNYKYVAYIIKLYLINEIDISYVQSMMHKFEIVEPKITGYLQYKIHKSKLKEPVYNKIGTCSICLTDDVTLQLFDCLGHYYCRDCTIKIAKCAVCMCTKKCIH